MKRLTAVSVVLILALVAPLPLAKCKESPSQVKQVRILSCEDPSGYVDSSITRQRLAHPGQFNTDDSELRAEILQSPEGAILLVRVMQEVAIVAERKGDQIEAVAISPPIKIDRTERLWWRFSEGESCAAFPRLSVRTIHVRSTCCDVPYSTFFPCFCAFDLATEVPHWAAAVGERLGPRSEQ